MKLEIYEFLNIIYLFKVKFELIDILLNKNRVRYYFIGEMFKTQTSKINYKSNK